MLAWSLKINNGLLVLLFCNIHPWFPIPGLLPTVQPGAVVSLRASSLW